jgi:hypothetical protein
MAKFVSGMFPGGADSWISRPGVRHGRPPVLAAAWAVDQSLANWANQTTSGISRQLESWGVEAAAAHAPEQPDEGLKYDSVYATHRAGARTNLCRETSISIWAIWRRVFDFGIALPMRKSCGDDIAAGPANKAATLSPGGASLPALHELDSAAARCNPAGTIGPATLYSGLNRPLAAAECL